MAEVTRLDQFFEYIAAAAKTRSNIKTMYMLKARMLMKQFTKEELAAIPEMTDGLDGYEMSVFWGIGIRNPAKDATTIRVAERQIEAAAKEMQE